MIESEWKCTICSYYAYYLYCFWHVFRRAFWITSSPPWLYSSRTLSVVQMMSNNTDQPGNFGPNMSFIIPLWIWMLMLILIISFLIWKIKQKFQYNLEAMYFIQLLLLLQLWLFYVEVLLRSMITRFINTTPYFIIELIHFCILMNRDILLLIQQGRYILHINIHLKSKTWVIWY